MNKLRLAIVISFLIVFCFGSNLKAKIDTLGNEKIIEIFPDENLATVIAQSLDKDINDNISQVELDSVIFLEGEAKNITRIDGIERLTNVDFVNLSENNISDLHPFSLSDFSSMQLLMLNNNEIVDISPLARLTRVHAIFLNSNHISDISMVTSFKSYTNNSGQESLYNFQCYNQNIRIKAINSPQLQVATTDFASTTSSKIVYNISYDGEYDEDANTVDWPNLDFAIKETSFSYSLTNFVEGGTWTYQANVIVDVESA